MRTLPARRSWIDWLPLGAPPLLAIVFVLAIYVDTPVSLPQTYRALLVGGGAVLLIQLALSLLLRSAGLGALAAAGVVLMVASIDWLVILGLVGGACAWEWIRLRRERSGRSMRPLSVAAPPAVLALTVAYLGSVLITGTGAAAFGLPTIRQPRITEAVDPQGGPGIYVLMLDAYARADTLAGLGFDNREFLTSLEELDFQVAHDSRSNYTRTGLTLASMFNMAYLEDIPHLASPPEGYNQQHRYISGALHAGNRVLDILDAAGYETFYIPSRIAQYAVEPVDHMLAGAELDNFELHLLSRTRLAPFVSAEWLYGQQRDRTLQSFAQVASIAGEASEPRFVFAHLMTPHPPFVFAADGTLPAVPSCFPATCSIFEPPTDPNLAVERYIDQVQYTNKLVLATVRSIMDDEPNAVVVLMSDHGSRLTFGDLLESSRNFMAVHATGVHMPDDLTPVALFPYLLNGYLDSHLDLPPARSLASLERTPWPMQEVP